MTRLTKLLMALLRSEITDSVVDKSLFDDVSEEEWTRLYNISQSHDLAHLAGDAVLKNKLLADGEVKEKFVKKLMMSKYRYQGIQYELCKIKRILNEGRISFIPLKGSVLRDWYPQPWMRTSCDIDILIHEDDLAKASAVLKNNGYSPSGQTAHDISFVNDSYAHLELHHDLIEEGRIGKAEQLLHSIWNYAKPIEGSSEHMLADEMFYYYHLAHMAKHLEGGGGCGIRPFLDLWIMNRYVKGNTLERSKLLSLGGLDKFATAANELVDYWIEGKEPSSLAKQLEEFILSGGVYGSRENSIVISVGKRKGKFRFLLNRIWMPYNQLIGEYPKLRGKRILQPFYEILRWCRLFKIDTFKRSKEELRTSAAVSDEKRDRTTQMLSDLGLI